MKLILLLFLSALVLFGALSLYQDTNTVTIAYQQWLIELPLWLVMLGLALGWLFIYGIFKSIHYIKKVFHALLAKWRTSPLPPKP